MHKLFERENLVEIPRVIRGLGRGALNVFIKPAISDLARRAIGNMHIPSTEEINKHIADVAADEEAQMREAA